MRWIIPAIGVLCSGLLASAGGEFLFTASPTYDEGALLHNRERFPAGARLKVFAGGRSRDLVLTFAASADADVSFDGKRVLFAGKRTPGDKWQVWEVPIAGGEPISVSSGAGDCIRPLYGAEDQVVYARRGAGGYHIEIAPRTGGAPRRLTWNPGNHLPNAVMSDGRIVYEAEHVPGSGVRDLYAVYTDGSGVETIRCDHDMDRHSAVELASGDIVFRTGTRLARFTSAAAGQVEVQHPEGGYSGPIAEVAAGEWLVSYRRRADAPFLIHRWKQGEPPVALTTASAFQPVSIRTRPSPPYHPSSLGNREGANVLCLNAYESKGPRITGTAASVRVWSLEVLLGETLVERDGSFFLQVPSERPLRFELLDAAGKTVRASKASYWMRKGEQRVCVGCHAGPERAPDNVVPQVLERTQTPVRIGVE